MFEQYVQFRVWLFAAMHGLITLVAIVQLIRHTRQFPSMSRGRQRLLVWTGGFAAIAGLWVVLWLILLTTVTHPENDLLVRFLMFGFIASFLAAGCGLNLGEPTPESVARRKKLVRYLINGSVLLIAGLIVYFVTAAVLYQENRGMNIFLAVLLSAMPIIFVTAFARWRRLREWQLTIIGLYGLIVLIAGTAIPDSSTTLSAIFAALICLICWAISEAGAWFLSKKISQKKEATRW